jgi:flagellar motor switch protein FliG
MSERAAKMLKEDMEAMAAVKLSDVEAVQYEIVQVARKLEEEGKIIIAQGGEAAYV